MERRQYVVQCLLVTEIEVESLDTIQAVEDALGKLSLRDRNGVLYTRIPQDDPRWETLESIDYEDLARDFGLPPGDQLGLSVRNRV